MPNETSTLNSIKPQNWRKVSKAIGQLHKSFILRSTCSNLLHFDMARTRTYHAVMYTHRLLLCCPLLSSCHAVVSKTSYHGYNIVAPLLHVQCNLPCFGRNWYTGCGYMVAPLHLCNLCTMWDANTTLLGLVAATWSIITCQCHVCWCAKNEGSVACTSHRENEDTSVPCTSTDTECLMHL